MSNKGRQLLQTMRALMAVLAMGSALACSFDKLVKVDDPESDRNLSRDFVKSRDGALGLYSSAMGELARGVNEMSEQVALMTDELAVHPGFYYQGLRKYEDARVEPVNRFGIKGIESEAYEFLHSARVRAAQARTILQSLNDSTLNHLIAATYAIEGYTIVILAENICSGSPLSEVPFEGNIRLSPGLSTEQLYAIAISKFDSSLAIAHDSARFINWAKIGKGRAYLGLGEYAQAATAVSDVPSDAVFNLTYTLSPYPGSGATNSRFWADTLTSSGATVWQNFTIANGEGANGLVWYTTYAAMDPRVPISTIGTSFTNPPREAKRVDGGMPFPLARWIDVKMIRAEHYLSIGDSRWLDEINEARHTVGLSDTTDPGTLNSRVNLLFRERAYWFYLEGVRLADFRRLVRQYNRSPAQVYPSGTYTRNNEIPFYGDAYVLIPPIREYEHNYLYDGCLHKNP